jgi:hypothetical protein
LVKAASCARINGVLAVSTRNKFERAFTMSALSHEVVAVHEQPLARM